jgi:hypothetical protein
MRQQRQAKRMLREIGDAHLTANMDLTDLTLRAREAAAKEPPAKRRPEIIKPVRTPLDDQVREYERQAVVKAVKRASGAESMSHVLDMDFSLLRGGKTTGDDDLDINLSLLNQADEKTNLRFFNNG